MPHIADPIVCIEQLITFALVVHLSPTDVHLQNRAWIVRAICISTDTPDSRVASEMNAIESAWLRPQG